MHDWQVEVSRGPIYSFENVKIKKGWGQEEASHNSTNQLRVHSLWIAHSLTHPIVWMTVGVSRMIGLPLFSIPLCTQPLEGLHSTLFLSILIYHLSITCGVHCITNDYEPFSRGGWQHNRIHSAKLPFCDLPLWPRSSKWYYGSAISAWIKQSTNLWQVRS